MKCWCRLSNRLAEKLLLTSISGHLIHLEKVVAMGCMSLSFLYINNHEQHYL
jgi:hypothetical protein